MTFNIYNIKILKEKKGNKIYKNYELTFINKIYCKNSQECIEKYKTYSKSLQNVYFSEQEKDGLNYFYIRNKKYLLNEGVNLVWYIY